MLNLIKLLLLLSAVFVNISCKSNTDSSKELSLLNGKWTVDVSQTVITRKAQKIQASSDWKAYAEAIKGQTIEFSNNTYSFNGNSDMHFDVVKSQKGMIVLKLSDIGIEYIITFFDDDHLKLQRSKNHIEFYTRTVTKQKK